MKTFKDLLNEKLTSKEIKDVETFADRLFARMGIDVVFTNHFKQRLNDPRNKNRPIKVTELINMFKKFFNQHKKKFQAFVDEYKKDHKSRERVVKDLRTKLNIPFDFRPNKEGTMWNLVNMSIMRKRDFKTNDEILTVEGEKP